ncbi:TfuA-like protein [Streptomyces vinaceus]|uniref:TfuA-like protein n=1 Tax=Streptomyces vinaceus TaxID=1960 RepID=UPI00369C0969
MIYVFVGPTLAKTEPQLAVPGVRVRPPARHGDLFDSALRSGDTVVLVDGVYHQALALRHKEILAAMGRGVSVIGAASIGALRAAELAPFGMLGVGTIYTSYVRGEIDGDDEVAVGQAPDGQWDALTWPLVNLRQVLHLAQAAHVLDEERAAQLLEALRAVYYPQRTTAAVWAVVPPPGRDGLRCVAGRAPRPEPALRRPQARRRPQRGTHRADRVGAAGRDPARSGRLGDDVLPALVQHLHPYHRRRAGAGHGRPPGLPAGLRPALPYEVDGLP